MKSALECFPCLTEQAVRAARRFAPTPEAAETVVRRVLKELCTFDRDFTSPAMGAYIHRVVAEAAGRTDLYAALKERFNREMMDCLPSLRDRIRAATDPFAAAVQIAIAANFIDFTAPEGDTVTPLPKLFERTLRHPLTQVEGDDTVTRLRHRAEGAATIVYLADNAGEIAADRLLIEQLPPGRTVVVVRGAPVANDVVAEDARFVGLHEIAEIIDNGTAVPGTLLRSCSTEVQQRMADADLIISKGQGNFETLDFEPERLFFLFAAKCRPVADFLGCAVGDMVVCDRPIASRAAAGSRDTRSEAPA